MSLLKVNFLKVAACLFCYLLMGNLFAMSRQSLPVYMKPRIMVLSLSSDGQYAISTDGYQHAVLWNLKKHTSKVVAKEVNIYSAYFIKRSNDYMYQSNKNNDVIVKDIQGKVIKQFHPGFATYGQILSSDLRIYVGADSEFNVYKIQNNHKSQILVSACRNGMTGALYHGPIAHSCTGFMASGKLLNFTFSPNHEYLSGSDGLGYLYMWNMMNHQKANIVGKNNAQTFATISPDGRYVVSVDQQFAMFKYDLLKQKEVDGRFLLIPEQLPHEPLEYKGIANGILSAKFIDKKHFIVFYFGVNQIFPFAGLFSINANAKYHKVNNFYTINPIKYLPLLVSRKPKQPLPFVTDDFSRDQAIDTSPSAHVLVMAMAKQNGILVYHYDPKTQTLKQVWAGLVKQPKSWWHHL